MGLLRGVVGGAPFVFLVGKGGTGKTTAAGALAMDVADGGRAVHLISTDPAHSLRDLFGDAGAPPLVRLEEFDAAAYAHAWMARAAGPLTELVEAGTWLDAEDVAGFTRLALPGVDELMAAQRLVELAAGDDTVVVDTAPTGHALRLLDAADVYAGMAAALRAMADKAAAVAGGLLHAPARLRAEHLVDELDDVVNRFRGRVLEPAVFLIATRSASDGDPVAAATARLAGELRNRGLRVEAIIAAGAMPPPVDPATRCVFVPLLPAPPVGPDALRAWTASLRPCAPDRVRRTAAVAATPPAVPAIDRLRSGRVRLWLVAGKGGTGKSTCAAALAAALADDRDVLLCSADPAAPPDALMPDGLRLRVLQIDAGTELRHLRDRWRVDVEAAFERIGLAANAELDRRVLETLWDLAPPGLDEIAALLTMLDAAAADETIVLDAAPTGHFLRLIAMPDLALDWTRQLMRVIVKYGAARAGGLAEDLLRLTRELHSLRALLRDGERTAAIVVLLDEPMVRAESARLLDALHDTGVPLAAVLVNRTAPSHPERAGRASMTIAAPELTGPPAGMPALREFARSWNIVE